MIWLGSHRGYLTDWVTQKWVQMTGRTIDLRRQSWLAGPVGDPQGIGKGFFEQLARKEGLAVRTGGTRRGLLATIAVLSGPQCDAGRVQPEVADFYEGTSAYELDAWGEWCGLFKPFGRLLALLFSRRLQQLNVPLSSLDTSHGISSDVIQLVDPDDEVVRYTAWVRELSGTKNVLYAGSYSVCEVPGFDGPCVKVVFPLPNGNAMVIMRPEVHADGSLSVTSAGKRFGDPGFYFTVHGSNGRVRARYLRGLRESIRVYTSKRDVRADHVLTLWRATFLRLHYRMTRRKEDPVEATI